MLRFTLKNIWAHKMRLVLSMISIFLGVAFLSGSLVFTSTIKRSFDDLFTSVYKKTDAVVQSSKFETNSFNGSETRIPVPRSLADEVKQVPGVREVEGDVGTDNLIVLNKKGKKIFSSQGPPTLGFGMPHSAELTQWALVNTNGNNLSAQETVSTVLADDEVLVDKSTSEAHNLTIGNTINVVTENIVLKFHVKGYMRFGTADGIGGAAAFFFNDKQASIISGQIDTYSQISVAADKGVRQEVLAKRIDAHLAETHGKDFEVITGKELIKQSQKDIKDFLTAFTIFLEVFAGISFFVALIIIINSFAIIMTQRKREYALLRAIGATSGQVRRSVFVESILVGLIASAFGVAGGVGISIGIRAIMEANDIRLPQGPLVIPTSAIIVGMVVGTLATFGSAFFPAWLASRVSPIEALRETAFEKNRRLLLRIICSIVVGLIAVVTIVLGYQRDNTTDRLQVVGIGIGLLFAFVVIALPLFIRPFTAIVGSRAAGVLLILFGGRRAFGVTGEIARRNNYRNPRRSARTSLALLVGVALVVFITVFASSATSSFSSYLKTNYAADIIVGDFNSPISSLSPTRCDAIDKQDFIKASSCIHVADLLVGMKYEPNAVRQSVSTRSIIALNSKEISQIFTVKHQGNVDNLGTNGVAISKDLAKKYNLSLGDKVTIKDQVFTVKAILDQGLLGPGGEAVVIDIQALNQLQTPRSAFVSMVVLKDGVKTSVAQEKLQKVLKNTGIDVNDLKTVRDQQIDSLNSVLAFFYGLLMLAIIIASIGILNTMSLSILERRRELGLMRAVGTTKAQVRGFVRFESIILAVLGTTVGMLFGIGSGYLFIKALGSQGFGAFSVAPVTLIVILCLSAIIGVSAGAWPAWRATKVDVLKAITVE